MKRLTKANLHELVEAFAGLQTRVLDSLHARHPSIRTAPHHQWPPHVAIAVDDVVWQGTRHGVGYRFEATDGRVIEAHDGIVTPPYPFDAYRLAEYADSLGIELIFIDNVTFSVDDTLAFERCLPMLVDQRLIQLDTRPRHGGLNRYTLQ